MNKVLVIGTTGFIGFHLTKQLVDDGYEVDGLDVVIDYYDINLKYARLEYLGIWVNQLLFCYRKKSEIPFSIRCHSSSVKFDPEGKHRP